MAIIDFIPERYHTGFQNILLISDDDFRAFRNSLSSAPLAVSPSSLAQSIEEVSGKEFPDLTEVFISVGSLSPYLEKNKISELIQNISKVAVRDDLIKADQQRLFEERLSFLINDEHIFYSARGRDLITEYGEIFLNGRVITDIRPIFGIDIEQEPSCGLIVHNLHIHYQKETESSHKDIYMVLDSSDIRALKEVLERAEKKEASLLRIMEKSGMKRIQ
ncbi:MAG TPA: hypothetical protein VK517_02520 [Cyclobacteriaceae bacterium]|nr:hypothetical protein [Cyclobacteriaceae bacterium]